MVVKRPTTIKDVAKKAGVSISTVSRVINDSKPVTNEVKQRVLDVIKETGYVPNPLARSLVTKKSQLIGVIVPEVTDTFAAEVLNGIEEISKMYDYDILLANTYSEKDLEVKNINLLRAKQVEGIVMISWDIDKDVVGLLEDSGIPAVYISKTTRDFDIYNVSINNNSAVKDMTNFLLDRGHKKIVLLNTTFQTNLADERLTGYRDAIVGRGLKVNEGFIKSCGPTFDDGYMAVKEMLESKMDVDAIFATSDEVAIGAINACFDLGYKVPEDISVVGFYDIEFSKMCRPKLTTVKQPLYDMGAVAIRMIIKMVKGIEIDEKKVELPYTISDRDSVATR